MSGKLSRTISRIVAVQMLYLIDFNKIDSDNEPSINNAFNQVISNYDPELYSANDKKFVLNIIQRIFDSITDIDQIISNHLLKHKDIGQLNIMLKSILRCGVAELMYFKTPFKVVVNEYVDIARDFVNLNEVNFTNAILDKIATYLDRKNL